MTWQCNMHNARQRQQEKEQAQAQRCCRVCHATEPTSTLGRCLAHQLILCARHLTQHWQLAHDAWGRDARVNPRRVETIRL